MRRIIAPVLCASLFATFAIAADEGEWRQLYNGRDLTGWKANNFPENFTIVDGATVTEEDLGVNFFLEESSLGKRRAEESAKFLVELNPDVVGKGIQQVSTNRVRRVINWTGS